MQAHAARIGMWSAVACLVLAAAGEVLPGADAIAAVDVNKILGQPMLFLGALDLFVAVMLGQVVLGEHLAVNPRTALVLGIALAAIAAATIALGRDEGAYEEELEAAARHQTAKQSS